MRRLDEAVAASQRALERDPLSPFLQWRLGYRYYLTRQWDRAIEQCRNALELDPHYLAAHIYLGAACAKIGNFEEAIQALETAVRLSDRAALSLGAFGFICATTGRISEAQSILEELQERAKKGYVPPTFFANIYLGLGDTDRRFEWLEKAVEEHDVLMIHFFVNLDFDVLRSDPRYTALLRKMNLQP